jgi:hypothetical protein
MDNLFKIRTLTTAVNMMYDPSMVFYNRYFAGKARGEISDRLAFDVITGSQKILANLSIYAPATVTDKTSRKTMTLTAPRLSSKRHIAAAELNAMRGYGIQAGTEMLASRLAREQRDMMAEHWRTLEFWAANAMKGRIYDSDMKTLMVDYLLDSTHRVTLSGTDLFSDASCDPIALIREWKRKIKQDSGGPITGWTLYVGYEVQDYLLKNTRVLNLLQYNGGNKAVRIAEMGDIAKLVDCEIIEHDSSYLDASGTRRYFVGSDEIVLIAEAPDLTDMPYAPIVDFDAPGGVGNGGSGQLWFSKSWDEKDPSGRWIKIEGRPLPVLQRPGNVLVIKALT